MVTVQGYMELKQGASVLMAPSRCVKPQYAEYVGAPAKPLRLVVLSSGRF
jgi:hypothetical protein